MNPAGSVSVIIPVYNGEDYLARAVASVRAQTSPVSEIIVIDDGSLDATPRVIESLGPGVRTQRQSNRGPGAARNRGLEMARGDFIAFLDADDLWTAGKTASQLRRLEEKPDADAVLGATQRVRSRASGAAAASGREIQPIGPVWMLFSLGAGLFRAAVFDTVGGFDEDLGMGEDVDWFLRAREAGVVFVVSGEVVQYYRRHDANLTGDTPAKDRFFLSALKRSLDRRRDGSAAVEELSPIDGLADFNPERGEDST